MPQLGQGACHAKDSLQNEGQNIELLPKMQWTSWMKMTLVMNVCFCHVSGLRSWHI